MASGSPPKPSQLPPDLFVGGSSAETMTTSQSDVGSSTHAPVLHARPAPHETHAAPPTPHALAAPPGWQPAAVRRLMQLPWQLKLVVRAHDPARLAELQRWMQHEVVREVEEGEERTQDQLFTVHAFSVPSLLFRRPVFAPTFFRVGCTGESSLEKGG